jgi:hypothetical protein
MNKLVQIFCFGRLAQVDRALVSGTKGRAFESRIAHANKIKDLDDEIQVLFYLAIFHFQPYFQPPWLSP